MKAISLDSFERSALESTKYDFSKLLSEINTKFTTSVAPEKGVYGISEVVKDNGVLERTYRTDSGVLTRDYFQNGSIFRSRCKGLDGNIITTHFDDNQTAYLRDVAIKGKNTIIGHSLELTPNIEIVKGNFSAVIDELGRPVLNKITDLAVNENGTRQNLSNSLRDSSYLVGDERGHIIADSLGGPATRENVVPQSFDVNRKQLAKVEEYVRKLKTDDNQVDYQVKTNYSGSDQRPSSFEAEVYVNGEKQILPEELQKIYNNGENTAVSKALRGCLATI